MEDYDLIESSFAQQYGIRLRKVDNMGWGEFCTLLSGLNENTALGRVVSIRAEKDPKVIKEFSKDQKRIYNAWKKKKGNMKEYTDEELEQINAAMIAAMKKQFSK